MASSRRMTREDRRESLLNVSATLVDREGAGALTFERLAEASEVAKTLPYAYFGSRDDILLTLFERVIGDLDDRVRDVLTGGAELDTVLARSLDVWFDAARRHGRLVGALLDARSVPGLADAIRRRDLASERLWHDAVAERLGLEDPAAHMLSALLNRTATATVELWLRRKGSRADLTDMFVTMASGAASALQGSR